MRTHWKHGVAAAGIMMSMALSAPPASAQSAVASPDGVTTAPPVADAGPLGLCRKADELNKKGDRKGAIRLYRQALEQDSTLDKCRYQLGILQMKDGQAEEALENLKRSVDAADKPAEAYNWLGKARAEMGDTAGAEEVFRLSIEKNPKFAEPHYNLAMLHRKQGKTAEARKELQSALKKKPNYKAAKKALAKLPKK